MLDEVPRELLYGYPGIGKGTDSTRNISVSMYIGPNDVDGKTRVKVVKLGAAKKGRRGKVTLVSGDKFQV